MPPRFDLSLLTDFNASQEASQPSTQLPAYTPLDARALEAEDEREEGAAPSEEEEDSQPPPTFSQAVRQPFRPPPASHPRQNPPSHDVARVSAPEVPLRPGLWAGLAVSSPPGFHFGQSSPQDSPPAGLHPRGLNFAVNGQPTPADTPPDSRSVKRVREEEPVVKQEERSDDVLIVDEDTAPLEINEEAERTVDTIVLESGPPLADDARLATPASIIKVESAPASDNPFLGSMSSDAAQRHRDRFAPGHTPFTRAGTTQTEVEEDTTQNVDNEEVAPEQEDERMEGVEEDTVEAEPPNPYLDLEFDEWVLAGEAFADRLGHILSRFSEIQRTKRRGQQQLLNQIKTHQTTLQGEATRLDGIRDKLQRAAQVF